jgi:hypothetical protein
LARRLFEVLRDEDLRRIAVWKLEGHTVDEIAAELGCACTCPGNDVPGWHPIAEFRDRPA